MSGRETGVVAPTDGELAVWRSFLRAHATLLRALEAELAAENHLPLGWYDVLVQLVEAPGRRLRMTELAERVLLSRSGVTRLVDRMVRAGLIRRVPCEDDLRGTYAEVTREGVDSLRAAAPVHLRGVATHMTSLLEPAELAALGAAMEKITRAAADSLGDDASEVAG
ncbi:MAG TPA: MarR family transcriptional regulator [Mycobacteriales bacterium]|jgi:DNA-binding MarR family transcriptional regulator